jgi:hypothetical protein
MPKHPQDAEDNESDDRPKQNASQDAPQVRLCWAPNGGVFRCESLFYSVQLAVDVSHDA